MRQSDRTRRRDEERRSRDGDVAGVGELRAVAERLLEAGARALENGREWLGSRSKRRAAGHHGRDDDQGRGGSGLRPPREGRWPDEEARSAREAGVHGADARGSNATDRHRGEDERDAG